MRTVNYEVQTIRSGQPRPYADHVNEYLITIQWMCEYGANQGKMEPWVMGGDVEGRIKREESDRAAGRMRGGESPDGLRKHQREWAVRLIKALCQNFREHGDQDGKIEGSMDAHFAPTLQSLSIDAKAGTIRAIIIEPYTD